MHMLFYNLIINWLIIVTVIFTCDVSYQSRMKQIGTGLANSGIASSKALVRHMLWVLTLDGR